MWMYIAIVTYVFASLWVPVAATLSGVRILSGRTTFSKSIDIGFIVLLMVFWWAALFYALFQARK